jgi:medium-chain acyl-[acyl-carrier-protein] hydrolase
LKIDLSGARRRGPPIGLTEGSIETMASDSNSWWTSPRPVEEPTARLFCFPYAGGAAATFKPWPELLPPGIEVQTLQLPGRPGRMNEPPIDQLSDLLEPIVEELEPLTDLPFAFYGHSMGSLIAFEVTKRLAEEFRIQPDRLFAAARRAPHLVSRDQTLHEQPLPRVREFLRGLRAVPNEVLDNEELMQLLLPALRADLKLDGLYEYQPGVGVSCPIVAFTGQDDEYVLRPEIAGWSMHAGGGFDLRVIPGDHFFMDQPKNRKVLLEAIRADWADQFA